VNIEINQQPDTVRGPLMSIDGVEDLKTYPVNGTTRCELVCRQGFDPREAIFHKVVENRWVLLEMKQEVSSLEDVFRELTKGGRDE
jgi:hypothetical protein